jgi:hypothetical protein
MLPQLDHNPFRNVRNASHNLTLAAQVMLRKNEIKEGKTVSLKASVRAMGIGNLIRPDGIGQPYTRGDIQF